MSQTDNGILGESDSEIDVMKVHSETFYEFLGGMATAYGIKPENCIKGNTAEMYGIKVYQDDSVPKGRVRNFSKWGS